MNRHYVIGNELVLYSNVLTETPERHTLLAILPNNDFNGDTINILNWKMESDQDNNKVVKLTYQIRHDLLAPIFDDTFPAKIEVETLKKPGRNYRWSTLSGYWINNKTGQKRYV